MKYANLIARLILGLIFFGAGLAFFFTTPPAPPEGPMGEFFKGMTATGYFFYLLKVTEITCGLLLLSGFFVPLALVILAPIILNIVFVHGMMMPSGLPLALVIGILELFLAFFSSYSPKIRALFQPK